MGLLMEECYCWKRNSILQEAYYKLFWYHEFFLYLASTCLQNAYLYGVILAILRIDAFFFQILRHCFLYFAVLRIFVYTHIS